MEALHQLLEDDISQMSEQQLRDHLSHLRKASESPQSLKSMISTAPRKKVKAKEPAVDISMI